MNTNTRTPQVKHLTLFLTVLLRYLIGFYLTAILVNHKVFTCDALSSQSIITPILKWQNQAARPSAS
jgi:hypothetical protein